MIAVILFQINILTLTILSAFQCAVRKKSSEGDGDVSLIQAGGPKSGGTPALIGSNSAARPANDDFSVGVPPPHIPLADKSDERTLADIESIQSEKVVIREKKSKVASKPKPPVKSPSAENSKLAKRSRSPAR